MRTFHSIIYVLGIKGNSIYISTVLIIAGMKDTQCGFKLFIRKAAHYIFTNMHVEGWIFDIEVIIIARHFKIPVTEVPITWQEVDGSKMNIMKDAIRMLVDLLIIRVNYLVGIWKMEEPKE